MISKQTIYCDLDSTVWPAEKEYAKALAESGLTFDMRDVYKETNGEDIVDLFVGALKPENVRSRLFYRGFLRAAYELHQDFDIHFVSHNPNPDKLYKEVEAWLCNYLYIDFQLDIYSDNRCKVEHMLEEGNAYGIIEDKPSTLVKAVDNGFKAYGFVQPWNLETLRNDSRIKGFTHWSHLVQLVTSDYKEIVYDNR